MDLQVRLVVRLVRLDETEWTDLEIHPTWVGETDLEIRPT